MMSRIGVLEAYTYDEEKRYVEEFNKAINVVKNKRGQLSLLTWYFLFFTYISHFIVYFANL